jgi:hypothetical protein
MTARRTAAVPLPLGPGRPALDPFIRVAMEI